MIIKQLDNNISRRLREIKYIVIHDTANKSKGANAQMHFNYFNTAFRNASADFFVDDKEIWKVNDYTKYYTWHVGMSKSDINNQNSIGIEMCVNADGDFQKTLQNTIKLVKTLQIEFPNAKVVRHYDGSGKNCPASLNYNNWEGWKRFMAELEEKEITWQDIINSSVGSSEEWINAINVAVNASKADGNLGALEIFKYLPDLILKIYKSRG